MSRSLVYLCSYSDYDMWKVKYPSEIIYSDPFCPRGVLLKSNGEIQEITPEYAKSRRRLIEVSRYDEEMLADGTGD